MVPIKTKTMRDAVIDTIYELMHTNDRIMFISADFGAPTLDKIRNDFPEQFVNIGIAEQNLINVSVGLALEGFVVYAYAIAPFISMRAYEQIRINCSLLSQQRPINVNMIGVGAGVSYDVSGPTHQCFEDISIIRTLPNIIFFSPCDWFVAQQFAGYSATINKPKYFRLDGKALPQQYFNSEHIQWDKGFRELIAGESTCIVSTGYFTHCAVKVAEKFREKGKRVGAVDIFLVKPLDEASLLNTLQKYKTIITLEEAFKNKGGIDSLIASILDRHGVYIPLKRMGFMDSYVFESGVRDNIGSLNGCSEPEVTDMVIQTLG